jgi:hypothetical protein
MLLRKLGIPFPQPAIHLRTKVARFGVSLKLVDRDFRLGPEVTGIELSLLGALIKLKTPLIEDPNGATLNIYQCLERDKAMDGRSYLRRGSLAASILHKSPLPWSETQTEPKP